MVDKQKSYAHAKSMQSLIAKPSLDQNLQRGGVRGWGDEFTPAQFSSAPKNPSKNRINPIITELFIRGRKLNVSLVFITQSLFFCIKKYQTKFYPLFYYENSRQTRTSSNRI